MALKFSHVTQRESELIRACYNKKGMSMREIADLTGRSTDTVSKHLRPMKRVVPLGRPKSVTSAVWKRLHRSLQVLQKKADATKEVTAEMVKQHAGVTASNKTVLSAFHQHGIWFRKLRERPVLTKEDVTMRRAWALTHKRRSRQQWIKSPHAIIDNKTFPIYLNSSGRTHGARRSVRGAFRSKKDEPKSWLVRSKKTMKFTATSVQVAAVVNGRVRMWNYVSGNWNSQKAADMYKGPLLKALKAGFPEKAAAKRPRWVVLEDNDPAGYKSSKAKAAKSEVGIDTDDLPKRSPDLNVLDYSLWHEVCVRMRKQEAAFSKEYRESKENYLS